MKKKEMTSDGSYQEPITSIHGFNKNCIKVRTYLDSFICCHYNVMNDRTAYWLQPRDSKNQVYEFKEPDRFVYLDSSGFHKNLPMRAYHALIELNA